MRRLAAAIGSLCFALALLSGAEARPPRSVVPVCPASADAPLPSGQARAARVLAPSPILLARLCRYRSVSSGARSPTSRLIDDPGALRHLNRRLNALPPTPSGPIAAIACPSDSGLTYILLLGYRERGPVGIRVEASGCRFVFNRHLVRRVPNSGPGFGLIQQLFRLDR